MRTNRLFSMNKIKRAMAITLATLLVVGSVNVMEVSAAGAPAATEVTYPQYDITTGKYVYPASDVFGAATHVHLFGLNVTSSGHTHGNIMAENANISNSGMHEGKIAYPNEYREVTYLGTQVTAVGSSITGNLILGSGVSYTSEPSNPGDSIQKIHINGGSITEVKIGDVYQDTSVKAVDIQAELDYLAGLSKGYAENGGSYINTIEDKTIHTNQTTTPDRNIYINIPYEVWRTAANDTITIDGLDSNVDNRGLVIINIDVGVDADGNPVTEVPTSIDLRCIGSGIVAKSDNGVYGNAEHSSAAFGSCRIVYNIIDSTKTDKAYTGDVNFDCIAFGSILAPRATVTVGAINGNVMAETINHTGNESHRLDVYPIYADSTGNTHKEYDEIRLLLTLEGQDTRGNTTGTPSETEYTLYTYNESTQKYEPVNTTISAFNGIEAVWNETAEKYEVIISSSDVTTAINNDDLEVNKSYYLVKGAIHPEYSDNDLCYEVYVTDEGTVRYAKNSETETGDTVTLNRDTQLSTGVLTDVLVKATVPDVPSKEFQVNVEFSGPDGTKPADSSVVTYEVYEDSTLTTPVTNSEKTAVKVDDDSWKVVFEEGTISDVDPDKTYYIKPTGNTSGYKDEEPDVFQVKFEADGTVKYVGTADDTTPPTDTLIKNEAIELNVVFTGEEYTGDGSDVTYDLCDGTGNVITSVTLTSPSNNGQNYKVVVDETYTTENLERNKVYSLKIKVDESSCEHDDVIENTYYVKFDANGNAKYSTDQNTWEDGPLEDELHKDSTTPPANEELIIYVKFNGPDGEPTGTNSGVKYQIYSDPQTSTIAQGVPEVEAVKDGNVWKVVFDESMTEDLGRNTLYYVTISDNTSGYKDVNDTPLLFRFDNNGDVEYVGTEGFSIPPTDLLIQNGPIELNVEFTGDEYTGTGDDVTYKLCEGNTTVIDNISLVAGDDAGSTQDYKVVIDSEDTTKELNRDTTYYLTISSNTSTHPHKDGVPEEYYVIFENGNNGNAEYSTDGATWDDEIKTDYLYKASVASPVPNGEFQVNVEFNGPNGDPTDAKAATVQYQVYSDAAASQEVAGVNATIAKDGGEWKAVFDADDTDGLAQERVYYVKVSYNGSEYKDVEETVYPVIFDTNGVAHYGTSTTASTTPYEDLLIQNGLIQLNVEFTGVPFTGTDSKVSYDLYKVVDGDVNQKVTATPVKAEDNDNDGIYEVIIDADFTTENLDRNEKYYLAISNGSDYKDVSTDRYYVQLNEKGNARYSTNENATLAESEVGPLRDILKKVINDKIEVNVEFSSPDGDPEGNSSGVKYEIYEKDANGTLVPVAGSVPQEAVKDPNGNWKVEFDEDATKDLDQEKDYFVTVSNNGSGYKDVEKDPYKVRFDKDGKVEYDGTESPSTPPTDLLIKNDDVKLNVELEGQENGGTDSNVTYDIYDEDGNKVTDAPIQATDKDGDGLYEVEVDSTVTNDLERDKEYYIEITDNGSDYSDKDPDDKFYFTFDDDGKVQYSPDGRTNWSDTPLKDVLVKQPPKDDTPDDPADNNNTTDKPADNNNTGNGAGTSADKPADKPAKKPSNSASNKTDSNNANDSKTDGNNVVITGGNAMDSAKTGEAPIGYIFAGFAGVIALLAGVYFFLKQRNA